MMVRLSPMIEVARLFNEVDRLLEEVTGTMMNRNGLTSITTLRPAVDLSDNGDALVLRAMVPGAQPGILGVAQLVQADAQLPQGALEERRQDRRIPVDTIGQAASPFLLVRQAA